MSGQMEKVFDDQTQAVNDQNDVFEIGDDLFFTCHHVRSNSITKTSFYALHKISLHSVRDYNHIKKMEIL